jgi:hypothetical protein
MLLESCILKQMKNLMLTFNLLILLTACGGGGGGGGGGGSSSSGNTSSNGSYSISVDTSSLSFTAKRKTDVSQGDNAYDAQTVVINYKGDGVVVGYPPGVSQPGWLSQVSIQNSGVGKALLTVDPAMSMAGPAGTWQTTLRVVTGKADGSKTVYTDINVSISLEDNLDLHTNDNLTFALSPDSTQQSKNRIITIDTWKLNWKLESNVDWINFSANEGIGKSGALESVTISINPTLAPANDSVAEITLSKPDGSLSTTKTIHFYREQVRYWFNKNNLALSIFDTEQSISKELEIFSNSTIDMNSLEFSSDANWLSIAKSTKGIVLTADRQSLQPGIHYATVQARVNSQNVLSVPLNIGLYIHDGNYPEDFLTDISPSDRGDYFVAQDPIRPHVLVIGANTLKIINFYTGAIVQSSDLPETTIDNREFGNTNYYESYFSDDGSTFFFHNTHRPDSGSSFEVHIYQPYDLVNNRWLANIPAEQNQKPLLMNGVKLKTEYLGFSSIESGEKLLIDANCEIEKQFQSRLSQHHIINNGNEVLVPIQSNNGSILSRSGIYIHKNLNEMKCIPHEPTNITKSYPYLNFNLSANGEYIVIDNELYQYTGTSGYSKISDYLMPQPIIDRGGSNPTIWFRNSFITNKGIAFIGRAVHTGYYLEPEYITEYSNTGSELRTIKQADEGGHIVTSILSSDERRLLVQHKSIYERDRPGQIRSIPLQGSGI